MIIHTSPGNASTRSSGSPPDGSVHKGYPITIVCQRTVSLLQRAFELRAPAQILEKHEYRRYLTPALRQRRLSEHRKCALAVVEDGTAVH